MRVLGAWRGPTSGRLYSLLTALLVYAAPWTVMATQAALLTQVWGDLQPAALSVYLLLAVLNAHFKTAYFVASRRRVDLLLDELGQGAFVHAHDRCAATDALFLDFQQRARFVLRVALLFSHGVAGAWAVTPLLGGGGGATTRGLPQDARYPCDTASSPPCYAAATAHQLISIYVTATNVLMVDVHYLVVIMYLSTQLRVLNKNLGVSYPSNSQEQRRHLRRNVKHHVLITRAVKTVQELIGPAIFVQFGLNIVIICIYGFVLTVPEVTDNLGNLIKCASNLVATLSQNFLYCWIGNDIIEQSEQLSFSVYSSAWSELQAGEKRSLQVILLRSHKNLKLNVGKLYTLSRETFLSLLNGSYSLFAVLHQVNAS